MLVLPVLVGKSGQTVVGLSGGEGDAVSVVMHSTGLVLSTPWCHLMAPLRAKVLLGPPNGPFESTVSRSDSRGPHQQAKKRWAAALLADHNEDGEMGNWLQLHVGSFAPCGHAAIRDSQQGWTSMASAAAQTSFCFNIVVIVAEFSLGFFPWEEILK